jgi:hypothetical protein
MEALAAGPIETLDIPLLAGPLKRFQRISIVGARRQTVAVKNLRPLVGQSEPKWQAQLPRAKIENFTACKKKTTGCSFSSPLPFLSTFFSTTTSHTPHKP